MAAVYSETPRKEKLLLKKRNKPASDEIHDEENKIDNRNVSKNKRSKSKM